MSRKSLKRMKAESEQRRTQRLQYYLDTLLAAYTDATDIDPRQACLIVEELPLSEQAKTGKRMKYYFIHHEPKINDQTAHPDVKLLMDHAMLLVSADRQNDADTVADTIKSLAQFLSKYEDSNEVSTESGSVVSDEIGQASRDS